MRFTLEAGADVDVLTEDELRKVLAEYQQMLRIRGSEQAATDANGNAALTVYQVPAGMRFALARVLVELDGFTPAVPYDNPASYVELHRNDHRVEFFNVGETIPYSWTEGGRAAPVFLNHEKVIVRLFAGPAATNFQASIEGDLYPLEAKGPRR